MSHNEQAFQSTLAMDWLRHAGQDIRVRAGAAVLVSAVGLSACNAHSAHDSIDLSAGHASSAVESPQSTTPDQSAQKADKNSRLTKATGDKEDDTVDKVVIKDVPDTGRYNVPIPKSGYYWGGISNHDIPNYGCANTDQTLVLECETYKAAKSLPSLKHDLPAPGPDGVAHTTAFREYLAGPDNGRMGCRDQQDRLRPGGDIWKSAHLAGRKALNLSFKCGRWGDMAHGGGKSVEDTYVRQIVNLVDELPIPTVLTLHHEPEDNACLRPKANNEFGTPSEFRSAYRHFAVDVRDQEAKNHARKIATGWIPMGWTFLIDSSKVFTSCANLHYKNTAGQQVEGNKPGQSEELRNPENWWPGYDAVDWIGADVYAHGQASYAELIKPVIDWANAACPKVHPKYNYSCSTARRSALPIELGELGEGMPSNSTPDERADWLVQMRKSMFDPEQRNQNSQIKMISYWGGDARNLIDWPSDKLHKQLKAYARITYDEKLVPKF